jgi:hypothetical protein
MIDSRKKSSLILVVAAALASTASDCEQSPRGLEPSPLATVQVRLESEPAGEPAAGQQAAFEGCLTRLGEDNNVKPSWRNYVATTLNETAPNNFEAQFFDVPVNIVHTMTVHDRNQCRRDPSRDGRVTTGVWVNGTRVERVVQQTNALQFAVDEEGVVESPPIE